MSKGRQGTSGRVTAFWQRFGGHVGEVEDSQVKLPLVLLLAAVIPEVSPKLYDNIEDRLKRVLEKGGKVRT